MKYLCLIYEDESRFSQVPKPEMDKVMGEYGAFTDGIKKSGHHLAGYQLQTTQSATTLRSRNGKVSTTDGPFAETKEQLGGFYLIEAKDLNDAVQVASRIPSVRFGSIEVRPVVEGRQVKQ
ncbi:MAG TPA: YciI family protein [Gemmatimonadaceae bacterium]|jgi:hypothetical protein|nr:YciI family protein [Gemmatimonadaceae bacterium]